MYKKHTLPIFLAIFSLAFVSALSLAWASNYYSGNKVVKKKKGGNFKIVNTGDSKVHIKVKNKSVDAYMEEQGIDKVEITTELAEAFVACEDGEHYHLNFTFGPSGCYFDEPLRLEIAGKYVKTGCHVWLHDENGEVVDGAMNEVGDKIIFDIPHFSQYAYDDYDYF